MFKQLGTPLLIVAHLVLLNLPRGACALEAPRINIPDQGIVGGTYLKMFRVQNIKAYLGIPYAKAERFSVPDVTPIQWPGVLNATTYGPQCWQKSSQLSVDEQTKHVFDLLQGDSKLYGNASEYDENCLNLNIFIPDGPPGSKGYAVVVWIPGRDFSTGSPLDIDPFQLVFKQKVLVITISYRVGIFGFLTTGDAEAPGNYGLMDQSAALFWIQKNIQHFGGNVESITLMGAAAGAVSVGLHLTSDQWSDKAFHKVVMMSGNPITENVVKTHKDYIKHLDVIAGIFGCNRTPTTLLIKCLRRVNAKVLFENIPDVEWGPVIDGGLENRTLPFIRDKPINLFKNGSYHRVPVLLGITDMEDILYLKDDDPSAMISGEDFKHFLGEVAFNDMTKLANNESECDTFNIASDALYYMYQTDNMSAITEKFVSFNTDRRHIAPLHMLADILSAETEVYAYMFRVRPKSPFYTLENWIGVPKFFDQIYVWGVPYMNNTHTLDSWHMSDKKISDIVMTMWANFFKASDPVKANVYLKWTSYSINKRDILLIDENFTLNVFPNNHVLYFWNNYYPKLLENAINCCNMRNQAMSTLLPQQVVVFLAALSFLFVIQFL